MDHFENYIKSSGLDVQMEYLGDQQLIALQVPIPILYWIFIFLLLVVFY